MAVYTQVVGNLAGGTNYASHPFLVTSGVTITKGDLVYLTSGKISNATVTGSFRPLGVAAETVVGTGTNKCLVLIDDEMILLMQNDNVGTTFAATHVGQYFDVTGATGAQLVDTSTASTTTGVLFCLEYNPQVDPVRADTTYGLFLIAESATDPQGV
jgi:hypothetical protein